MMLSEIGGNVCKGFSTPSGKGEFVSAWLAKKPDANGNPVNPLPVYTPRDWQPDKDYPLYFINWKEASHTHSRTQNNPLLLEIKPEAPVIIHPDTAAKFGIGDGDRVIIESQYGKVEGKAKISKRMHREVIGLQHGFGHTALGKLCRRARHLGFKPPAYEGRPALGWRCTKRHASACVGPE